MVAGETGKLGKRALKRVKLALKSDRGFVRVQLRLMAGQCVTLLIQQAHKTATSMTVQVGTYYFEKENLAKTLLNLVHGIWADWSDWSVCSLTCGKGKQSRTRVCSNPAPQFGGDFCE